MKFPLATTLALLLVIPGCAGVKASSGGTKPSSDDLAFIGALLDAMKSQPGHRGVILINRQKLPDGKIQFANGTVISKRPGWDPFGILYNVTGVHCIHLEDIAPLAESRGFPAENKLGSRPDNPMLNQSVSYVLRDGQSIKRFIVHINPYTECMTQFGVQGETKGFTNRFDKDGNWER